MVNIQSPTAEIRRGKKRKKKERNSMKILWSALLHRATIITFRHLCTTAQRINYHPAAYVSKTIYCSLVVATYCREPEYW